MAINKVYIRGCPGQGTTWFAHAIKCVFVNALIISEHKHNGCHVHSAQDQLIDKKIISENCSDDCIYAVISRHPNELKHGRSGSERVWESYYGAWSRTQAKNVAFYRYEDVVTKGCTAKSADPQIIHNYFKRRHRCLNIGDQLAWNFWNYTNKNCTSSIFMN